MKLNHKARGSFQTLCTKIMENYNATKRDLAGLFIACLPVGLGFLFVSYLIIVTSIRSGEFSVGVVAAALFTSIIGWGILQFIYLIVSKKSKTQQINNGVLYLASIAFMLLAVAVLLYMSSSISETDACIDTTRFSRNLWAASTMFSLGLCGFVLARTRSKRHKTSIQNKKP